MLCVQNEYFLYIYTIHIYIKALYTYKYEIIFLYERLKRILTTTCVGSVYTSSATRPKTENWFQQFKNYIIWRHQNIFAPYRARIYKKKTLLIYNTTRLATTTATIATLEQGSSLVVTKQMSSMSSSSSSTVSSGWLREFLVRSHDGHWSGKLRYARLYMRIFQVKVFLSGEEMYKIYSHVCLQEFVYIEDISAHVVYTNMRVRV